LRLLYPVASAEQVVLIGDHMQLGPTYSMKFVGPKSPFERILSQQGNLLQNPDCAFTVLDTQYRMHEALVEIPNTLFYQNQIQTAYKYSVSNFFISRHSPLLFVNLKGPEKAAGTSRYNAREAAAVAQLL